MKYLLFGTGEYYQRYKKWFEIDNIVALVDNSIDKQHTYIDGIKVLSPTEAIEYDYDYIVILSFYVKAMKEQLIGLGVPYNKIIHFFDIHKLNLEKKFELQYYGCIEQEVENNRTQAVLLLSTDLELQGGPVTVLIRFAKILKKNGIKVIFGSMQDGSQKESLLKDGIPVVIDPNLQVRKMADIRWTHGFRKVICNTIGFNVFITERDLNTPVSWWLHDSAFFYDGVDRALLSSIDLYNLDVYSVGKVPREAIQEIIPSLEVKELLYGVDEDSVKIIFMVLGYIEKRKGQDILIDAIQQLDESTRQKALFYLVGNDTSEMAKNIKKRVTSMPEVIITGKVSGQKKRMLMRASDVLICPSREDPMPAAVVEAVMINKMPIVSDASGFAEFIEDNFNGMVFKSEDSHMLADKIKYCIDNASKVREMGKLSRKIFQDYFSMDVFEKSIIKMI